MTIIVSDVGELQRSLVECCWIFGHTLKIFSRCFGLIQIFNFLFLNCKKLCSIVIYIFGLCLCGCFIILISNILIRGQKQKHASMCIQCDGADKEHKSHLCMGTCKCTQVHLHTVQSQPWKQLHKSFFGLWITSTHRQRVSSINSVLLTAVDTVKDTRGTWATKPHQKIKIFIFFYFYKALKIVLKIEGLL